MTLHTDQFSDFHSATERGDYVVEGGERLHHTFSICCNSQQRKRYLSRNINLASYQFRTSLTRNGAKRDEGPKMASPESRQEIGKRLRQLRYAWGFDSADEWVKYIGGHMDRTTWIGYESGNRLIPVPEAIRLCARFQLSTDWIYRGMEGTLPPAVAQRLRQFPIDSLPPAKGTKRRAANG
jgi:hypothetical protein